SLEAVGRSPRLECAAAQHGRPGRLDHAGSGECLLPRLDGAGPGDQREGVAADPPAASLDYGRPGRALTRHELVRLSDRQYALYSVALLECESLERLAVAEGPDHQRLV